MEIKSQILKVQGQKISFRQLGSGKRKILFFHGFPGSSSQINLFSPWAAEHDLSVLAMDRPGYNQTQHRSTDHLAETLALNFSLCKKFGWTTFEVVAVSGGTPFALSFCQKFSEHVLCASVLCGLGPLYLKPFTKILGKKSLWGLRLAPLVPGKFVSRLLNQNSVTPRAQKWIRVFLPQSQADKELIAIPQIQASLRTGIREAFLQDGKGPKKDAHTFLRPWGWDLEIFKTPLQIWHGKDDQLLHFSFANEMANLIPKAKVFLIEGEGHYSLPINHISQVLTEALRLKPHTPKQ